VGCWFRSGKGPAWGTQLQHPEAQLRHRLGLSIVPPSVSAAVFEIGLSATRAGSIVAGKTGWMATFLEGAFITNRRYAVFIAPFLGTAIGAALTTLAGKPGDVGLHLRRDWSGNALLLAFVLSRWAEVACLVPARWMETFQNKPMAFPVMRQSAISCGFSCPKVNEEKAPVSYP